MAAQHGRRDSLGVGLHVIAHDVVERIGEQRAGRIDVGDDQSPGRIGVDPDQGEVGAPSLEGKGDSEDVAGPRHDVAEARRLLDVTGEDVVEGNDTGRRGVTLYPDEVAQRLFEVVQPIDERKVNGKFAERSGAVTFPEP